MNKKTIQLWIILLISVLCVHLKEVSAKKNSEEIIVINNTGGCGSGAKTIVKTEGGKKKKKSGHSIILSAGGGGGKCEKHHHTKVIHVPVPIPVPVPIKQEEHQDHWGNNGGMNSGSMGEAGMSQDSWGSSSGGGGNSQEDSHQDHWASASSNDEIKPLHKSQKISSASVPSNRAYGHMMSRMEKQAGEQKNTLLHTLLEKSNRLDKKSLSGDSRKKNNINDQLAPQLITHHFMNPNQQISAELLPAPAALFSHEGILNSATGMMPALSNEMQQQFAVQHNQFHDAIQHQMQQQFEHQKMHEAIASSHDPHQLSPDSPLVSQLPIPSPGQSLSAPVFEPIDPINQTQQAIKGNNKQQSNNLISQQFNELEIIPYEVQQQLQATAHLRQLTPQFGHEHSMKGAYQSRENSLIDAFRNSKDDHTSSIKESMNKNKKYEMINKDHAFDVSSSNAIMDATFAVLPPNMQQQSINHMDQMLHHHHHSSPHHHHLQQPSSYQEMMNMLPLHSFMMINENKDKFANQNDLNQQPTFQIPIIISAPEQYPQEEKMTVKRFKI